MTLADDYAKTLLAETREELVHADGKASILFSAGGVIVGIVAAALLSEGWEPSNLDSWAEALWWAGTGLVLVGLLCLGAAVLPRIRAGGWFIRNPFSQQPARTTPRRTAAHYFGDLAPLTTLKSARQAVVAGAEAGLDRTVEQAWVLSKIVLTKYRLTQVALSLYGIGGISVLIAHLAG